MAAGKLYPWAQNFCVSEKVSILYTISYDYLVIAFHTIIYFVIDFFFYLSWNLDKLRDCLFERNDWNNTEMIYFSFTYALIF